MALLPSKTNIDWDEFYWMKSSSLNEVFNILSIVPVDFEILNWKIIETFTNLFFQTSRVKAHKRQIRKFRDIFRKFVVQYLEEVGFIPEISKIIVGYCYDNHSKMSNLSKRKIKVKLCMTMMRERTVMMMMMMMMIR